MPRGEKPSHTDKQKRQAENIEAPREDRGVARENVEPRAWAAVDEEAGAGEKAGPARGKARVSSSKAKAKSPVRPPAKAKARSSTSGAKRGSPARRARKPAGAAKPRKKAGASRRTARAKS